MKRFVACVLASFFCIQQVALGQNAEIVHQWKWLNFTFESPAEYDNYVNQKLYQNCMLAGVKMSSKGDTYVSVPRWNPGVPATLSKLVQQEGHESPLLQPYPSWDINNVANPKGLKSVLGFEIDSQDRIWILDQGKMEGKAAEQGSIKLYVYDLNTNELIHKYFFSEDEAPLNNSFLNDIVIDMHSNFAYITDSGIGSNPLHGGILVYDATKRIARRVLNQVNSTQPAPIWITINGEPVLSDAPMQTGADGIALSFDTETLYFCPLTSRVLYSVDTKLLKDFSIPEAEIEAAVLPLMDKWSASDGLACSNEGNDIAYMTALENDGILKATVTNSTIKIVAQDANKMIWPDTIGFDHHGSIVWVSNQLHRFMQRQLNWDQYNFYIWKTYIGANSYLDPQ